jgi:hypothetical protein
MEEEETSITGVNTRGDQDNISRIGNDRELSPPWPPIDDGDKDAELYFRNEKEENWEYPMMA